MSVIYTVLVTESMYLPLVIIEIFVYTKSEKQITNLNGVVSVRYQRCHV